MASPESNDDGGELKLKKLKEKKVTKQT